MAQRTASSAGFSRIIRECCRSLSCRERRSITAIGSTRKISPPAELRGGPDARIFVADGGGERRWPDRDRAKAHQSRETELGCLAENGRPVLGSISIGRSY